MQMSAVTRANASGLGMPSPAGPIAPYVSPFRQLLERGRWVALAVLLLWALACFWALRETDNATRVIGHDTAPSISAAEHIRSLLSDANGNLANILLTNDADGGPFTTAFRADVADAEALLVEAAQNITYGDAEKTPITAIMRGVADYEQLVGQARTQASGAVALKADALMRGAILPAAEALDKANDDQLSAHYAAYLGLKFKLGLLVWLMSLAALIVLGTLQYQMFKDARRLVNPGLAAATLIIAIMTLDTAITLATAGANLKTAKSDAFDSIYALTTLQAVANDANATESYWLVAYDDPAQRKNYEDLFQKLTHRIVDVDLRDALYLSAAGAPFQGLLGDELANITFAGEREAALATLKAWASYIAIDGKLRALQTGGRRSEAIALDVGTKPGQSNWAFDVFEKALTSTLKVNQDAFDAAIASSEAKINAIAYGVLFAAWLMASGAAWYGIRQRLRDYEF